MKEYYENEFNECISKDGLSREEQQDCYKRRHQNLANIEIIKRKKIKEAQNHFDEQTALQCSICWDQMGCMDDIKVLPCLHEFHYKCIQDMIKLNPMSYSCPICRNICNFNSDDPKINLQSVYCHFFHNLENMRLQSKKNENQFSTLIIYILKKVCC